MYDDLLGPKKESSDPKVKAKNAVPEGTLHDGDDSQGRHGSVSSCSDSGIGSSSVCNGDCVDCEDDFGCDGESQEEAPTPKDPWADVTPGPDPKPDPTAPIDDDDEFGWLDDDCDGDCDNCADDECRQVEDEVKDFFDSGDAEGSWVK